MDNIDRKELLELALLGTEKVASDLKSRLIQAHGERIFEICSEMADTAEKRKVIQAELQALTDKEV